ncbi:Pld1, partial [Symbiodinium microadriaticum]
MYAPTERIAREWTSDLQAFYNACPRSKVQHFNSSFPPRHDVDDVHAFTCSRDYYYAVAVEMLKAQEDIFISAWKLSPAVILTRPPLPPIRLEQILKYKANQGVKIYILLYKEVEMSRQGNNSLRAKKYLEGISPNIKCIRHPNKFFGSTTAILWSHHEKLVIVD